VLNIALHEIGHAIGVEHIIKSESAIMAPLYQPTMDSYGSYMAPKLTAEDVGAARKIYGKPSFHQKASFLD
jgi:predicted Zn-dependent protease